MTSTPRTRPMRWPALALGVVLLMQLPATALADHTGRPIGAASNCDRPVNPPRCTSVGDDRMHRIAFDESLSPALTDAMRFAMSEVYDPTRLTMIEHAAVTKRTDVVAFSGDFGDNGAAAWVYCPSDAPQGMNVVGDRWCRHQELYFNLNPRYSIFFDDDASRRHVACHELGHTLGLRHWGNPPESRGPAAQTCLNANTPNGPTFLHGGDIDHINDYPYTRPRRAPSLRLVQAPTGAMAALAPLDGGLVGTDEVERPVSLDALVNGADLVIVGRVAAVEPGRAFGPAHQRLHYAAVTVKVDEVLSGAPAEPGVEHITLEVPMHDGPEQLMGLRQLMLGTERLLFLRNKGASAAEAGMSADAVRADRPFYRLLTFGSEVASVDDRAVPAVDESGLLDPFADRPFAEVVAVVRATSAQR
jgi:hypothetical protein